MLLKKAAGLDKGSAEPNRDKVGTVTRAQVEEIARTKKVLYLLVGNRLSGKKRLHQYLHWMHLYGKWSMLDVFVVAILVVAVKLGAIANVEMRYGLYAFAASVLITMFITARIVFLTSGDRR